jgi:hypothetical protein
VQTEPKQLGPLALDHPTELWPEDRGALPTPRIGAHMHRCTIANAQPVLGINKFVV